MVKKFIFLVNLKKLKKKNEIDFQNVKNFSKIDVKIDFSKVDVKKSIFQKSM